MTKDDAILERINKASLKLLHPLSLQETYKAIVNEALKLVDAELGTIILEQDGQLKRVYFNNKVLESVQRRKRGYTYKAFTQQRAIVVGIKSYQKVFPVFKKLSIKSSIIIPFSYRGKSIGVMIVHSVKEKHFSSKELETLKVFGSMASLAIRKAQLSDEINKALETRDLFISMAAHEFRTPLTTINGYVQLLSKKFAGKKTQESDWIREMTWECYRLNLLISELLEINRIRTGKLVYNWSEHSLRQILKRSIINFKFGHNNRVVVYEEGSNIQLDYVIGDFDKLLQVFTNLLDNAAKFSPSDSKIILRLTYRYPLFKIAIQNEGHIDKEDLPKIFNQFYKGSEHKQGLGLGLFITKTIIERHKGTIDAKSSRGKKITITVKLPRAAV